MAFFCINCKATVQPDFKACPFCGEPITDFLRTYLGHPIDGKYQILSRLGVGGMGEVYKVLHVHLNSIRVVKLMRPSVAAEESAHERFIREARLATKIHHPNVATLYDFSTLPDGSYYMVWEYIQGTNLADLIRPRGCLSPKYAAQLAYQALLGLDAIHRVGIVHRDISPENLMMATDEEGEERVKVIDLGIAKQWSDSTDDKTKTGMFVGKWKYCSPEHLGMMKPGERIDGRADIYSFGIVLYEMLTGAPAFVADTPHRYLMMHASETAKRFAELNPQTNIPAELESVVFRALEKDREKRFPTAREFARALHGLIPGLDDQAILPSAAPYANEATQERALEKGKPSSMQPTVTKKKSITEEAPLPSHEEEKEAFERLTTKTPLPGRVSPESGYSDAVNQELVGTVAAAQGYAPTVFTDSGEGLLQPGRTIELAAPPAETRVSKKVLIGSSAALVLVLLAVIVGAIIRKPAPPAEITPEQPAEVAQASVTVVPPGRLGINAFPWGEVIAVRDTETGEEIPMAGGLFTPGSQELPPGS